MLGCLGVVMIVVLTCFQDGRPFWPLTHNRPVAMLPFMNIPIIQTHIEHFVEAGFSRFLVVATDYPIPLQEFLGNGSRWGASIDMVVLKDTYPDGPLLERLSGKLQGAAAILMPAEVVLDVNVGDLVAFRSAGNDSFVRVFFRNTLELVQAFNLPKPTFKKKRLPSLIYTGIMLTDGSSCSEQAGASYLYEGNFMRIETPLALWSANMAGLGGFFSTVSKRYHSIRDSDIRVGHHFRRANDTELIGPALVGHHVRINSQAALLGWNVVGNGVFIDKGAHIGRSVIADHTYIGAETSVENSIVQGKLIYNLEIGQWVEVSDSFIISDIREKVVVSLLEKLFERLVALGCLIVSMPIIVLGGLIRKVRGKKFVEVRLLAVTRASKLARTRMTRPTLRCLSFERWDSLIGRLPGLINVVLGQIRLVGVRPLEREESPLYQEEWTKLREDAPCGLFTPVDAEGIGEGREEAKIVAENYYAATRSVLGDIKILLLGAAKLLSSSVVNAVTPMPGDEKSATYKKIESG